MKVNHYRLSNFFWVTGLILLAVIILIFALKTTPLCIEASLNTEILNHFGSLVGGLVGTFFSLAGIFLIIHTIKEQEVDNQKQKIESRFFELLKIHCDNINHIKAGEIVGRYAIQKMIRELRICLEEAQKVNTELNMGIDDTQILNFGYLAFYYGCAIIRNEKSAKTFRDEVPEYDAKFVDKFIEHCTEKQKIIIDPQKDFDFKYEQFYGHQIRLSHYFRHIFHTITYINRQETAIVSAIEKYDYVKLLRAQLSPQEQSLIFHFSMSKLGHEWEKNYPDNPDKQIITKYNMIRNVLRSGESMSKYYPCVAFEGRPIPPCRAELRKQYT